MAKEDEKEKVGLNDVEFRPLGAEPGEPDDEDSPDEEEQEEEQEEEEVETSGEEIDEEGSDEIENEEDEVEGEVDEDEEGEDPEDSEVSVFASTAERVGLDIEEDEDFESIDFADPDENDLENFIETSSKKLAEKRWKKTLEKYPEAEAFVEYAKKGGDPRQYIDTMHPQVDYNKVDFDEQVSGDDQAQEQVIRNHLHAQGEEQEEIDEIVEDYRNGGILEKRARHSLGKLQKMQEQAQQDLIEKQEKQAKKREEQAEQERKELTSMIDESEALKGMKIPDTDKDDLKSYIFDPVTEEGHPQAMVDGADMTREERLVIAYLKMKDFDFNTLIDKEAESKNARKIKKNIKKNKEEPNSTKKKRKRKTSGKIQDIEPIF